MKGEFANNSNKDKIEKSDELIKNPELNENENNEM